MIITDITQSPVGTILSFKTDIPEHSIGSFVTTDGSVLHRIKSVPLEAPKDILLEKTEDFVVGQEVKFLELA